MQDRRAKTNEREGGREGEGANLKQEGDVLDVGFSLLLKKTSIPSLKTRFWEHVTSDLLNRLSIIYSCLFLPSSLSHRIS